MTEKPMLMNPSKAVSDLIYDLYPWPATNEQAYAIAHRHIEAIEDDVNRALRMTDNANEALSIAVKIVDAQQGRIEQAMRLIDEFLFKIGDGTRTQDLVAVKEILQGEV